TGYGLYLEPTYNGTTASLVELEEHVRQRVLPWDDILWFPTPDEQAAMLAERFPADVIMYAFASHPDWIPENVRKQASAQVTFGAPQGGWGVPPAGQGYPPVAGGFGYPQPGAPAMPPVSAGIPGYPPAPVGVPGYPPAAAGVPGYP